jgi:hypothetical protein
MRERAKTGDERREAQEGQPPFRNEESADGFRWDVRRRETDNCNKELRSVFTRYLFVRFQLHITTELFNVSCKLAMILERPDRATSPSDVSRCL